MLFNISIFLVLAFSFGGNFVYSDDDVLNIGDHTEHMCYKVIKTYGNPMSIFSYVIGIDTRISKVLDSADLIWQSSDPNEYLSLLRIYRFYKLARLAYVYKIRGEDERPVYIHKHEGVWVNVSEDDFSELVRKYSRNRRFDLSEPDEESFDVVTPGLPGLPSKIFLTQDRYKLTLVQDDFDIIWQAEDDFSRCTCVVVHGLEGDPRAVNLHISGAFSHIQQFHIKVGRDWEQVPKPRFYALLSAIDHEIASSGVNVVVVNE